jgi:alpha-ribazole phosphatase
MSKGKSKTTRWWWVRHAPVINPEDTIYGQSRDLPANVSEEFIYESLAKILPHKAHWLTSNYKRTRQTADAIIAAGVPCKQRDEIPEFAEQHFGDWEGLTWSELHKVGQTTALWLAPAEVRAPNGESWLDVFRRTKKAKLALTKEHQGKDIICVAHGGSIRAAVATALDMTPAQALTLSVENCSVTRLDHFHYTDIDGEAKEGWRLCHLNFSPKAMVRNERKKES